MTNDGDRACDPPVSVVRLAHSTERSVRFGTDPPLRQTRISGIPDTPAIRSA